jgi:cell division protease FtsH
VFSAWALQVARVAKMMITQMGMSDELGQVAWSSQGGQSFVGQQMGQPSDCSDATNSAIDDEIKSLVERAYR